MASHRLKKTSFTRQRLLTFPRLCLLILQRTARSVDRHLSDFFTALGVDSSKRPTGSAWTQARAKFKHTAFIALNEEAVLANVYGSESDFEVRRWRGFCLIGMDSSLTAVPEEEQLTQQFGRVKSRNQSGVTNAGVQARLSVAYDLLNHLGRHTLLENPKRGERQLAYEHLSHLGPQDLTVMDRGYASYELFGRFDKAHRQFVCRCGKSTFGIVDELLTKGQGGVSVVVTLKKPKSKKGVKFQGLPEQLTVRFVTVSLPDGQIEVLATSLLDQQQYPTEDFAEVYHARWGVETYYGILKGRLDLEHFSGKTLESVLQDVHATVFLSNLETVLIEPAQAELANRSQQCKYEQQVNHAVAFHTIKSRIIELLLSQQPLEEVLDEMRLCFLRCPQPIRPGRRFPRKKLSGWKSYRFQRYERKCVF